VIGARVAVVGEEESQEPGRLMKEVRERQVTVLEVVPAMMRAMMEEIEREEGRVEEVRGLRKLLVTGEELGVEVCRRWKKEVREVEIVNAYGPTECSDDVTQEEVGEEEERIAIGRPLRNTRAYVEREGGEMGGIGEEGELMIGGEGVGRGYYEDREETAQRYIPDGYGEEEGVRVYRTGDRVRRRRDGKIEYVGRKDEQVKVRGYRIELGEIEYVIQQHEAIDHSVVVVADQGHDKKRLIAYIVSKPDYKPLWKQDMNAQVGASLKDELRHFLEERLPSYMIPSAFVILDAIPLTSNGKLDRKALPAPAPAEPADMSGRSRTTVEDTLAGIWEQVLGLERVGIHQNFFEMGGDSIISIQIVAKAQQMGISITPRQVFQHQTIADLARAVSTSSRTPAPQGIVTGHVPLTPIQARFFEQGFKHPHHFNQSLLIECRSPVDKNKLEEAIKALMLHHDALRMRFSFESGQWRQTCAERVEVDVLRSINVSGIDGRQREHVFKQAAEELQASLDLQRGPAFRVAYFERSSDESVQLLMVAHHLVIDIVSWRILTEDLERAYGQLVRGEAVRLPEKTTSYQQWAKALAEYKGSESLRKESDYWLTTARCQTLAFPRDRYEGDNIEASQTEVAVELSRDETERLVREVPKAYGSELQEVLLAALIQSVTRWSGDQGLLVELERHGREEEIAHADLTRTVGWFTSIYPVWFPRAGSDSLLRHLEKVCEDLRAVPQRGIGYGILRYLNSESPVAMELAQGSRPEICFNYMGQLQTPLPQDGFFRLANGSRGAARNPDEKREWVFEVNCWVIQGRFHTNWAYSRNLHNSETVEQLAQDYLAALRLFIEQSTLNAAEPPDLDMDVFGFDAQELDSILAEIDTQSESSTEI
jgi:non-ribosomal peptide synthase protein (TIGR01720 family)